MQFHCRFKAIFSNIWRNLTNYLQKYIFYIYVYTYIHTHTHTHMYMYTLRLCVHAWVFIYIQTHTHLYNLGYHDLNPQNYAFPTKIIIKLVQKRSLTYITHLPNLTPKLWISDRNHHQIRSKHMKICQKNHSVIHWGMLATYIKKKKKIP